MSTEGVDAASVLSEAMRDPRIQITDGYIAALLAVNPGGHVLLSPDGKLSAWEPPTLTDEEREGRVWWRGEWRQLEQVGRVDKPSPTDTFWSVEGDEIQHPTTYLDLSVEQDDITHPDDPGWYDPVFRLAPPPVQQEEARDD